MAVGVSKTGFENKEFDSIITDIIERAKLPENYGTLFPTTPDSMFGVFANIIGASLKDQWDLVGSAVDQQNRDKAEGKFLDDLAALTGITRLLSTGSSGTLEYTGLNTTVIPFGTQSKTAANEFILVTQALTLNRNSCHGSTFSINTLQNSTMYTVTINGTQWDHTSDATATELEIVQGFVTLIGTQSTYVVTLGSDNASFEVDSLVNNNTLITTNSANLALVNVKSFTSAIALVHGPVSIIAAAINTLVSNVTGVVSVTNGVAFNLGRLEEQDEDLRQRMSVTSATTSAATKPSILARIKQLAGVTEALLTENNTTAVDGEGRPANSYEVFVNGGTNADIATVIWTTKPVGIQTVGDVTNSVVDINGDTNTVFFSRFTNNVAWVRITYTLDAEGIFPADGVNLISQAVVDAGALLNVGDDIEPTKFYGPIYQAVKGIFITNIEIAVTTLATDTPTYQTTKIVVGESTVIAFDAARVPVST